MPASSSDPNSSGTTSSCQPLPLCPCLPQGLRTVHSTENPGLLQITFAATKNGEWMRCINKGNTPADCHRSSFINILELIWWWILHGFPSCNEYINTSKVSSLCSENMTEVFKSKISDSDFSAAIALLFGAPIFHIPTDSNDSCYRKGPYLSQKLTRQSPECTICTCHHLTFIETETRVFQYYEQSIFPTGPLPTNSQEPSEVLKVWQIIAHFPCLHFCIFI